jgi:hypothetical protein
LLVLGEIRTCLLQNSGTATRTDVAELLRLSPGDRVRSAERPLAQAVSPELVSGVDCRMPAASGARIRGVGTVMARGVVTGGRVLQGSVYTRLEPGDHDHRLPWSYYLSRPGVIETIGRFDRSDVMTGFFSGPFPESTLDLGALSERLIGKVQMSSRLDHVAPFKSRRTRLRWMARTGQAPGPGGAAEFTIADDNLRTFSVTLGDEPLEPLVEFCEDLALHDWVLTTLLQLVERSNIGAADGPDALTVLRPAVDHLLHLWMPGARVARSLLPLWESLEQRPGFTRQWQATVSRIRDQLALNTLAMLNRMWHAVPQEKGGQVVGRHS